jgi:hypothetical protein
MAELAERHEITIRGHDGTIVFTADSTDGWLVIRQIPEGKKPKDVCSITLADPDELRAFFKGLRRIVASLEHGPRSQTMRLPRLRAGARSVSAKLVVTGTKIVTRSSRRHVRKMHRHLLPGQSRRNRRLREDLSRERPCNTSRAHKNDHHAP